MALSAAIGHSKALDAREAGAQAARQAVDQLGRDPVVMGFLICSYRLSLSQVITGVTTLLGDAPLLGFSTSAGLVSGQEEPYSVSLALLTGAGFQATAEWQADFGEDSRIATQKLMQALAPLADQGTLMMIADGFNGDAREMFAALPQGRYQLLGGLAGGDLRQARTYQAGGRQSGYGGVAAAYLDAKVSVGVGVAHGWQPVGAYFNVTQSRGLWLRTLNGKTAAEQYSALFGYPARDWSFPPLNEMVRLYGLNIERGANEPQLLRSPLRMESDGSLRMHSYVPEGSIAHLMVGSVDRCAEAAEQAARQALDNLRGARPVLALVLPDVSWQTLTQTIPGLEFKALQTVLGAGVPLVGGYTYGQLARNPKGAPELYNQHIEVILFGEQQEG